MKANEHYSCTVRQSSLKKLLIMFNLDLSTNIFVYVKKVNCVDRGLLFNLDRGQRTDILFNLVTLYDQLFMRMDSSFPVMTEWVIYHDQTVKLLCVRRTIIRV